ncbi:copper amine oxidase [Salipaludibacillus neizhouensis]|uniref:Copper amine oxidase n=1 Tax=Salipaludibacillus neizhouensis TaxID=885475 RepID=A0A3A9K6S0_9BACI|nr:copper amine oxidase [Salipaludibacillus neizhouensis]RKL67138.1 copper amine oxidase [Salipaludibacillus neizhouensis]
MNWKRSLAVLPLGAALLIPANSVFGHGHDEESDMEEGHGEYEVRVSTPAADLRATLDQYLSEHAFLAVLTMQKGIEGAEDFEATAGALSNNTDDLTGAIASVYGDEAGEMFRGMWEDHIGYFVDYVTATAEEDEAGREAALAELDNYRVDFSEFLESATEERLEAGALAEGLQMHVDQLVWAFDNYNAGEFGTAYDNVSEAMEHMFGVGKGLSTAIVDQFDEDFEGSHPDTPAADLRADLNFLFSEHAALAVVTMQKGIDGAEDFESIAGSLNENTEELSAAIASVYGEEAGEAFNEQWSEHIGYFVDYVTATAEDDEMGKEEALENLDGYRATFSEFLETATEERLDATELADGLQMHVNQLVGAFDSYVEGDYETTYENVREAYGHMYGVGEGVSGAIVDQFPEKFESGMPSEMPKTGLGGMSDSNSMSPWYLYSIMTILLAAGVVMITRRKTSNQQ